MNKPIQIDLQQATLRAEEMLSGLTVPSIKLHDFAATIALIIGSMSEEYEIDSMLLMAEIENFAVQIFEAQDE